MPRSPSRSSSSRSKHSKGKAKQVPHEFAVTASPFPPESPALDYEYANNTFQVPSGLGGTFEVIPEVNEAVFPPDAANAKAGSGDISPSYGRCVQTHLFKTLYEILDFLSAPSNPELGSPATDNSEESSSPAMRDEVLPNPYSPSSAQNGHSPQQKELVTQEEVDSEYSEVAAAHIMDGRVTPSSRFSIPTPGEHDRIFQPTADSLSRSSSPHEEQYTRYHTPEVPIRQSSRSSSRASGRSSHRSNREGRASRSKRVTS